MNSNYSPPKWPLRILKKLIHNEYLEEIEGDLEELYQDNITRHSRFKSQWLYTMEVIKLLRPLLLKSMEGTYRMNHYGIIKNYFKVAYRNIRSSKLQNFIKTGGITIALATSMTIYQYISFEKSFDNFHPDIEQLYRVDIDRIHAGVIQNSKSTSYSAFGPDAKQDLSGIEEYTRVRIRTSSIVINKDSIQTTYSIQKPAFVDPSFLSIFNFGLDQASMLADPNSIILTESSGKKYFGEADPLGQIVTFIHGRYELRLKVKAIIPDVKPNSHIQFEALVPYHAFYPEADWISHSWDWSGVTTYLKLRPEVSAKELESSFPVLVQKYKGKKMQERDMNYDITLRRVKDIHLQSHLDGEFEPNGNEQSLYFLGIAALLILAVSWLNNVNITTAHNSIRTKEMLVRRALGAHKSQVFTQLFVESLLTHVLATILAIVLFFTLSNPLQGWLNIYLNPDTFTHWDFWGIILTYIVLGSAIVSFDYKLLINVFKHKNIAKAVVNKPNLSFRKIGVTFQFGILVSLIIMTWAVNSQLNYIQNYELGLDKEKVLIIEKPRFSRTERMSTSASAFQSRLQSLSCVQSMTSSYQIPGSELGWSGGMRQTTQPKDYGQDLYVSAVNENYIRTLGLKIIAGSSFENISCEEHSHVILNQTATRLLGYESPEDAIHSDLINSTDRKQRVVGVIEDFHYNSLRDQIPPLMLSHLSRPLDYLFIKIGKGNIFDQIDQIETTWKKVYPNAPFSFFFLDERIDNQYKSDRKFKKLFATFAGIAMILSIMGIIGLSTFYATRRIKEIGVRKVLGANLLSLVWLLSNQFVTLIVIGSIIALPVSYVLISTWLEDFVYQVEISWMWFIGSALLVLVSSWVILTFQTLKTARINPSESLRDE